METKEENKIESIQEDDLGNTLFGKYITAKDVVLKTEYSLDASKLFLTEDKKIQTCFIDNCNS